MKTNNPNTKKAINPNQKGRAQADLMLSPTSDLNNQAAPYNKDIEAATLGLMLIFPDCIPDVLHELPTPEVFYFQKYQIIFRAIQNIHLMGGAVDMLTVSDYLRRNGELSDGGNGLYPEAYDITECTNKVVSPHVLNTYLASIKGYYLQRESYRLSSEMMLHAYSSDPVELLNSYGSKMLDLQERLVSKNEYDLTTRMIKLIREREEIQAGKLIGLDCGFYSINRETSGLCKPDLIIIAARPAQGKTAVIINMARSMCLHQSIPVGIFSLEMSAEQLIQRIEAAESGLSHDRIRRNLLNPEEKEWLFKVDGKIAKSPLIIDDTAGLTISQLRTKAMIMKRKFDIKCIMVDYLQLMSGDGRSQNREAEISAISRGLKLIAKELQIPVIALSQLSRKCEERVDKKPQLSDLRESGAIEQDADIVAFLMRPEYYNIGEVELEDLGTISTKGLMMFIIAKNRHNAPNVVPLKCDLGKMLITDYVMDGGEVPF